MMTSNPVISLWLTQLVQISATIALVWVMTVTLCRHRPQLAYLLWLVVLVKCLVPAVWSSPTSLFSWIGHDQRASLPPSLSVSSETPLPPTTPLNASSIAPPPLQSSFSVNAPATIEKQAVFPLATALIACVSAG